MAQVDPGREMRTKRFILLAAIWQGLLAMASTVGATMLLIRPPEGLAGWLRVILLIVLLVAGIASGLSVAFILRRQQKGRILGLAVNYLALLFCVFGLLHILGVFTGIDALGGTFGKGLPWLGGVIAGYLVSSLSDHFKYQYERAELLRRIGQIMMVVFAVISLLMMSLLKGLLFLVSQFNRPLPFLLLVGIVLTAVILRILSEPKVEAAFNTKASHSEAISGVLFLSPNLLGFLFFFAGPLLLSLYVSFTNSDSFGQQDWVGLDNYAKIVHLSVKPLQSADQPATEVLNTQVFDELTRIKWLGNGVIIGAEDKLFWISLRNTLVFALLALPLSIIPALLLAALLNSKLPGMKFFRAIYFLPTVAAVVGVALIWQWLYNASVGYINYSVSNIVTFINSLFGTAVVDPQIRWLSDTKVALLAVVIMSAWQWVGYYSVIFLAGMQNIPKELYEAATVDGAGVWTKFKNVTIPLLAPTTFFIITTAVINALQVFEQVYVLIPTEPPGGPANSTMTIVLYLYQKGFQRFQQGYASAVAWVLFLLIFIVTLVQFRRQRKSSGAY